jgi:hypothetical protein
MISCPLCSACDNYSSRSSSRLTTLQKPLTEKKRTGNERMSRSPTDVSNQVMRSQNVSFDQTPITGLNASAIFPPLPFTTEVTESMHFFQAVTAKMHLREERMARTSSLQQKLLDRQEKIRVLKMRGLVLPSKRNVGFDVGSRNHTTPVEHSSRNSAIHGESTTSIYSEASHQLGNLNKFERVDFCQTHASNRNGKLANDSLPCDDENARPSIVLIVPDLTTLSSSGDADDASSCLSYDTLAQEGLNDYKMAYNITKSPHSHEKERVVLYDFEREKTDLPLTSMTPCSSYSPLTSNNSTNHKIKRSDYASKSITGNPFFVSQINSPIETFTESSISTAWSTASTSVDSVSIFSSASSVSLNEDSARCVSMGITSSASSVPIHQGSNHRNSHPRRISDCSQESKLSFSKCDSQGRCVHHPHIQLNSKHVFGGLTNRKWKPLLINCTECCYEEVVRLRKKNLLKREQMGSDYADCADVTVSSSSSSDYSSGNLHLDLQYEFSRSTPNNMSRADDDSWNSLTSMESGSSASSSFMTSGFISAVSPLNTCSPIQSHRPGILRRPSVYSNLSKKNNGNRGRVVFAGRDDIMS